MAQTLQSFIGGRWQGKEAATPLYNALTNGVIYHTHAEQLDFEEAVRYGARPACRR